MSSSWVSVLWPGSAGTPGPRPRPAGLGATHAAPGPAPVLSESSLRLAWSGQHGGQVPPVCAGCARCQRGRGQAGPQSDLQSPDPCGQLRGTAGSSGRLGTSGRGGGSQQVRGWPPGRRQEAASCRCSAAGACARNGLSGPWFQGWALPPGGAAPEDVAVGPRQRQSTQRLCLIGFSFVPSGSRTVRRGWAGPRALALRVVRRCLGRRVCFEGSAVLPGRERRALCLEEVGPAGTGKVRQAAAGGQASGVCPLAPGCEGRRPGSWEA